MTVFIFHECGFFSHRSSHGGVLRKPIMVRFGPHSLPASPIIWHLAQPRPRKSRSPRATGSVNLGWREQALSAAAKSRDRESQRFISDASEVKHPEDERQIRQRSEEQAARVDDG